MLDQLMALFQGYSQAYGRYEIKRKNDRGKMEGKALTITTGPATEELWKGHLSGEGPGIGIIPLLDDNTVVWACIDVDVYPLDLSAVEKKVKLAGYPLVICRTKSGGAHLFLFMEKPTSAELVLNTMSEWAARLGYGGCEIFPKQTQRVNENDVGNWLNMPYYNTKDTNRYCIRDGQPIALAAFIKYANSKKVGEDKLNTLVKPIEDPRGLFEEGPPCLQHIFNAGGFGEGTRNDGMFSVGVYVRKRFPDDWQDKMQVYNVEMCDPVVPHSELSNLIKSVGKKAYDYRCKQSPLKDHCDRKACLRRIYGIGEVGGASVEISNITKFEGDPVIWFVEIGGHRLQMSTAELQYQTRFHKICIERLNIFPDEIPKRRWSRYIHDKLQDADILEAPEESATTAGQFRNLLDMFLNGVGQLTDKDELVSRFAPYRPGDGTVWFRLKGLTDFLENHSFHYGSSHHVCHMLRELGGESVFKNVKGKGFKVWVLEDAPPEDDDAPLPTFQKEDF